LVSLPFVGPAGALAAAAAFAAVDVAAPVPVPVSDNILNPVVLTVTFLLADPWLVPWFGMW
ncbi:MAG TPA: hypothetical protein VFH47_01110, partial [Candidatus Thermoplasmatota archaeon]|nr:hypothetical protein [Candidatus Thermoplasmatota archaeon]